MQALLPSDAHVLFNAMFLRVLKISSINTTAFHPQPIASLNVFPIASKMHCVQAASLPTGSHTFPGSSFPTNHLRMTSPTSPPPRQSTDQSWSSWPITLAHPPWFHFLPFCNPPPPPNPLTFPPPCPNTHSFLSKYLLLILLFFVTFLPRYLQSSSTPASFLPTQNWQTHRFRYRLKPVSTFPLTHCSSHSPPLRPSVSPTPILKLSSSPHSSFPKNVTFLLPSSVSHRLHCIFRPPAHSNDFL
jgi:hypothetical protein